MAWVDTDRVPVAGTKMKDRGVKDGWHVYEGATGTQWRVKGKKWQVFKLAARRKPKQEWSRWRNAYVSFKVTGDVHWVNRRGKETARHINQGDMLFLKVRSTFVKDEGTILELRDEDATIQMSPFNVEVYFVDRMYFTGKVGADHRCFVITGKDYIVVDVDGMGPAIWEEQFPRNTDKMLNAIDHSEWVRVRAHSHKEALANYQAAMEQYEQFCGQKVGCTDAQNKWCQDQAPAKTWIIEDWAGRKMNFGEFPSFEAAEAFLSEKLGDDYETDRGEYEVVVKEDEDAK